MTPRRITPGRVSLPAGVKARAPEGRSLLIFYSKLPTPQRAIFYLKACASIGALRLEAKPRHHSKSEGYLNPYPCAAGNIFLHKINGLKVGVILLID